MKRVVVHAAAEFDRTFDEPKLAGGTQNESGALGGMVRAGRTLRTPEFVIKTGAAHVLVKGSGMIYAAVGQHIMLAGPLHGNLVQRFNSPKQFQWIAVNLTPYKGHRAHLEITASQSSELAIIAVVQGSQALPLPHRDVGEDVGEDAAAQLDEFVRNLDAFVMPGSAEEKALAKVAAPILEEQRSLLVQIRHESRVVPAMQDGSGTDECVFTRGNPKTPGPVVPRRYLEALGGADFSKGQGSGRLELARQMTDPTITPFITRVYVNRVWHHLFGRGIVASVDNFGVLGEVPTHPELLDFLAHQFAAKPQDKRSVPGGLAWSTKGLIRMLVLSSRLPDVFYSGPESRRRRSGQPVPAPREAAPARR